jgi:hypothetical protein
MPGHAAGAKPVRTTQPGDNVAMRGVSGVPMVVAVAAVAACGAAPPPPPALPSAPTAAPTVDARLDLAARAAAAGDRRHTARYTLAGQGRPVRMVTVVLAADGTWRVDVPGGALGGTADVAFAQVGGKIFSCSLPTTLRSSACVQVATSARKVPARVDPQVQHAFTDWTEALTDQQSPLSVSRARALTGAQGDCFAVESTTVSVSVAVDPGIYCFTEDGVLTAARTTFGTLTLAGAPVAAPPSVDLPGPVVAGQPLGMASPPPPPPSPSPSPTPSLRPSTAAG